jgi:hypothetical protein
MARKELKRLFSFAAASVAASLAAGSAAVGQSAPEASRTDIGTEQAGGDAAPEVPQTAAQFTLSAPSLDQVGPTRTLKSKTLRKILVPAENYNDIARLTPSKHDIISPVGPGLRQDFGQSVRGPGFPINFSAAAGNLFHQQRY